MHISRPSMQNTFQLPRFTFGPLKEDILVSHKVVLTTNQSVHCTLLENHKKVSFNTASEASYVYILSGRKLIKNAKNGPSWRFFENLKFAVKQCYQTGQF